MRSHGILDDLDGIAIRYVDIEDRIAWNIANAARAHIRAVPVPRQESSLVVPDAGVPLGLLDPAQAKDLLWTPDGGKK